MSSKQAFKKIICVLKSYIMGNVQSSKGGGKAGGGKPGSGLQNAGGPHLDPRCFANPSKSGTKNFFLHVMCRSIFVITLATLKGL